MTRNVFLSIEEARAELPENRTKPDWLTQQHALPFSVLSDDEFEILCFLLLKKEYPEDEIRLYGKTGDGGRDILHFKKTATGVSLRLVQCKRYKDNIGIDDVRVEMAKVWVNVFNNTIERPSELVFYAVPDLTNKAKDLVNYHQLWKEQAVKSIKKHLRLRRRQLDPKLADHAVTWWPAPLCEGGLLLTERIRKHSELIDEFFAVRKVIDGSKDEVAQAVAERIAPTLEGITTHLGQLNSKMPTVGETVPDISKLKSAFSQASRHLLRWPTELPDGQWIQRKELDQLLAITTTRKNSATVLLGPPGSGKSALLAKLGLRLTQSGTIVLAIKADSLKHSIDSAAKLAEFLNLSLLTEHAVKALALQEPVVLLLDQLDALADLADLHSERLHVLLELVSRLSMRENIHIICSCREIEFRHDGRLSKLEAEEIALELPCSQQVIDILSSKNVIASGWPPEALELLRAPFYLTVFLRRLSSASEQTVFRTYQELFQLLWKENVISHDDGRVEVIADLVKRLSDREELWCDLGLFEKQLRTIEALVADDILRLSEDGFQVGFRHQSLFEFARARSFSNGSVSLSEYVIQRQDAMFVRPTLWMTLNYLRRANPGHYSKEFNKLWTETNLRRHIKHLLIDFLSHLEGPQIEEWEKTRLIESLQDASWRRKVLNAISGKKAWFAILHGVHLSAEMQKSPEEALDTLWVLISAQDFDLKNCLILIEQFWLPPENKRILAYRFFERLGNWTEEALILACKLFPLIQLDHGSIWHITQHIGRTQPVYAIRFIAAWLAVDLRRTMEKSFEDKFQRDKAISETLEQLDRAHGIQEIAEAEPIEFINRLWPIYWQIETGLKTHDSHLRDYYQHHFFFSDRLDKQEYAHNVKAENFFLALDSALRATAQREPAMVLKLVDDGADHNSLLAQRLFARALMELIPEHVDKVFEFLLADKRRFGLGGKHDNLSDTIQLIQKLAPHLSQSRIQQLTSAISSRDTDSYLRVDHPEYHEYLDQLARGRRLRLLSALPANQQPDPIQKLIEHEKLVLPQNVQRPQSSIGGSFTIESPVPLAQLEMMTDQELERCILDYPDEVTSHPTDYTKGGSDELARVLHELTKKQPGRMLALMDRLQPTRYERTAATIVDGLIEAQFTVEKIEQVLLSLDRRGFGKEEFKERIAHSLDNLGMRGGLSDELCTMLNRWRYSEFEKSSGQNVIHNSNDTNKRISSIIWQHDHDYLVSSAASFIMSAITTGYLNRKPRDIDSWLSVLEDQLQNIESSVEFWQRLAPYLTILSRCNNKLRVQVFFTTLFTKYPNILHSSLGCQLFATTMQLLSDDNRENAFRIVNSWETQEGTQAYFELLTLRHLISPDDKWASDSVQGPLDDFNHTTKEPSLIGIAFAAANLWEEPSCRLRATELLCRLLQSNLKNVTKAVFSIFNTYDDIIYDRSLFRIFEQLLHCTEVLDEAPLDELFFDHLLDAYSLGPDIICRICEEVVSRRGKQLQSMELSLYGVGSALIDVSLRLQRSGPPFRERGLELFERLLDLGVNEAISLARNNDLRLAPGGRIHRHRRKKKKVAE